MCVDRTDNSGCVLSDGRFAVFGGMDLEGAKLASCEVLTLDGNERREPPPPMLEARRSFLCAAMRGCVIVADGLETTSVGVYEEALGRWRRLPCNLPHGGELFLAGSAIV